MRVLVLSTQARLTTAMVDDLRLRLPVEDVALSVVLVSRPAERLPVERCLVVGASLRPRRRVRERPTATSPLGPAPALSRLERLERRLTGRLPRRLRSRRAMLATGATWSPLVREEFARSDLVIALDYNASWAAWQLARRIEGPAVAFRAEGAVASLTASADGASGSLRGGR